MKVILTAIGTSGDVFPLIALGIMLKSRGHEVVLITHGHFGVVAIRAGLGFSPIGSEQEYKRCVVVEPQIWDSAAGVTNVLQCAVGLAPEVYETILDNIQPGRTIIVAHYLDFASRLIQQTDDVPVVTAVTSPMGLRFADPGIADQVLPPQFRSLQASLGPGWNLSPLLTIGLFPAWLTRPQRDWPSQLRLTGFLFFDGAGPIPTETKAFLDSGSSPIVFRPGPPAETAVSDAKTYMTAAADACRLLRRRGLVLGAFQNPIQELPSSMHHAAFAPLTKILPHCAALVHHGGIGTIAAGMKCGLPQLAVPMCLDQPDNAACMRQLGVGDLIAPREVSGPSLAARLNQLLNSATVKQRCADVAHKCRQLDSAKATCELIEAVAPMRTPSILPQAVIDVIKNACR